MKILKLPNVTGYIITGILVGAFVFDLLFNNFTYDGIKESLIFQYANQIKWVSTIALMFIAFSIGTSFKISASRTVDKREYYKKHPEFVHMKKFKSIFVHTVVKSFQLWQTT